MRTTPAASAATEGHDGSPSANSLERELCETLRFLGGPDAGDERHPVFNHAIRPEEAAGLQHRSTTMALPDFRVEHLKRLPLRGIVAFAARCARRVEPLSRLPEGDPRGDVRRAQIEAALRLAEGFAGGSTTPPDPRVLAAVDALAADPSDGPARDAAAAAAGAAHAAASAWNSVGAREVERFRPIEGRTSDGQDLLGTLSDLTVDLAALDAYTAAVNAYEAAGAGSAQFVASAQNDYDRLLRMELGQYPEPGRPINPAPDGPLGPL